MSVDRSTGDGVSLPGDCITRADIFRTEASKSPRGGITFSLLASSRIDYRSSSLFFFFFFFTHALSPFRVGNHLAITATQHRMIILIPSDKSVINSFPAPASLNVTLVNERVYAFHDFSRLGNFRFPAFNVHLTIPLNIYTRESLHTVIIRYVL